MSKKVSDTVHVLTASIFIIFFVILITGCTTATITTPDGVVVNYKDFHPTGNVVEIDAKWQGVGSLSTKRSSEGSEELVGAVGDAVSEVVDSATNPLN